MEKAIFNNSISTIYAADDYNNLGQTQILGGELYQFCSIAANSAPIRKYDRVFISAGSAASLPSATVRAGGVAPIDIPTSTSTQYAWIVTSSQGGYPVNVNVLDNAISAQCSGVVAASAITASYQGLPLAYTGSGASALPNGQVSNVTFSADATGTTAQYTSAAWNTTLAKINNALNSTMRGVDNVSAATGVYSSTSTGYKLPSGTNYDITGATTDVSADLRVGDLVTYNGQTRIVTAVNTASGEYTATINSGFSATATGQTLSVGKMRVRSIFY